MFLSPAGPTNVRGREGSRKITSQLPDYKPDYKPIAMYDMSTYTGSNIQARDGLLYRVDTNDAYTCAPVGQSVTSSHGGMRSMKSLLWVPWP